MEEVFVLRVPQPLADRLRRILAEDATAAADLELQFGEDGRTGTLRVATDMYPAKLLDLPTKVESWKTLDDVNLVKAADIGQIIVVSQPGAALATEDVSVDGVTLAMRCVLRPSDCAFRRE
jgi:transcription initiation factor TFIID subunit 7